MNPLCIAASIAAQLAYVIGARRTTRNRRDRAITVASFNLHHNSDLARSLRGEHGPIAQKAAQMFVDDQRAYHHRVAS